jgi:addiction module RelE/StbE family toxin
MTVKWSKRALSSLAGITEYIEQDNPTRAKTFVQEIRQKSNLLEQFPSLGRAGRAIGTRELVAHKNYILVYRVRGDDVQVIEVMHTSRKFPASF